MSEKTIVVTRLMTDKDYRDRIRAVAANKGKALLSGTPTTAETTWSKLALSDNFDAFNEAMLVLLEAQPASEESAKAATDAQLTTTFNTVFSIVLTSRGIV